MNSFGKKRLFNPWLMIAIAYSGGALIGFGIFVALAIHKSWLGLVIEGFIAYCFASSAVFYWHRYYAQKKIRDKAI